MLERHFTSPGPARSGSVFRWITVRDLAILTREKASEASHFAADMGNIEIAQAVNEWITGELMTLETPIPQAWG